MRIVLCVAIAISFLSAQGVRASAQEPVNGPTFSSRLVEDLNESRLLDAGDSAPQPPVIYLTSADDPAPGITLFVANDGTFAFTNLPAGVFSWRLYWPAGFIEPQASVSLPHILRGMFEVTDSGVIIAPDPLPDTWPGLPLEPVVPEDAVLGALPPEILLARKDPDVLPVSTEVGATGPLAFEYTDVTAAFGLRPPQDIRIEATYIEWTDLSTTEDRYVVNVRLGGRYRGFELPPDSTRLDLPEDLRPGCGIGRSTAIGVVISARFERTQGLSNGAEVGDTCPPPVPTERLVSTDYTLSGRIIEDVDGDGQPSQSDTGQRTLVELRTRSGDGLAPGVTTETELFSMFSTDYGTFTFRDLAPGVYILSVWSCDFINVVGQPTNLGLYRSEVTVGEDGGVIATIPEPILVVQRPSGTLCYPVRSGIGWNLPISLPETGVGAERSQLPMLVLVAVAVVGGAMLAAGFATSRLSSRSAQRA